MLVPGELRAGSACLRDTSRKTAALPQRELPSRRVKKNTRSRSRRREEEDRRLVAGGWVFCGYLRFPESTSTLRESSSRMPVKSSTSGIRLSSFCLYTCLSTRPPTYLHTYMPLSLSLSLSLS